MAAVAGGGGGGGAGGGRAGCEGGGDPGGGGGCPVWHPPGTKNPHVGMEGGAPTAGMAAGDDGIERDLMEARTAARVHARTAARVHARTHAHGRRWGGVNRARRSWTCRW